MHGGKNEKITFFSYKGGAGRTSMLFNTLPFMVEAFGATPEEPIVVIDLDVDSKGLSYLFDGGMMGSSTLNKYNSIDALKGNLLEGSDLTDKNDFFQFLQPVGNLIGRNIASRSVLFITAHKTREDNQWLSGTNNRDARDISLRKLRRICNLCKCKALVMDAPAGDQLAGQLALEISDTIVTVMRITQQFRDGTYDFLSEKGKNYPNARFVVVPNAVPASVRQFKVEDIIGRYNEKISKIPDITINTKMLADGTGINEVQLFKYREECLNLASDIVNQDEKNAIEKYKSLAKVIAEDD